MQTFSKDKSSNHLWRNDITGLRALAVIPVLFYHAFPELLPGGFFGVDIFFVISGYLISGIIFRGVSTGTFSYWDFYQKRIRRIIPNLIVLCLFVLSIGYFFLLPFEYANLGKHIVASGLFIQNFNLLSEAGYFTEDALRKPLLHLWSLAVEEQFYIVFPILISVIWKLFNRVHFKTEEFWVPYPKELKWSEGNKMIKNTFHGVARIIDVEKFICDNNQCNTLKYKDDDHLNPFYLETNAVWIDKIFDSVGD